jgi:hypothetical protein
VPGFITYGTPLHAADDDPKGLALNNEREGADVFTVLQQAVAVMGASQLGVQLSTDDVDKITAFLDSLTGEQPKVTYPVLPPSVGATPRPQPSSTLGWASRW